MTSTHQNGPYKFGRYPGSPVAPEVQAEIAEMAGWFDYSVLYDQLAKGLPHGAHVVELGVFAGQSLRYLAETLHAQKKAAKLWGIDLFGSYGNVQDLWAAAKANCGPWLSTWQGTEVQLVRGNSLHTASLFPDEDLHLVWVDTEHTYDQVRRELPLWWPKVARGGVFAGHDYHHHHGGVVKAVDEFAKKNGLKLEIVNTAWLIRK